MGGLVRRGGGRSRTSCGGLPRLPVRWSKDESLLPNPRVDAGKLPKTSKPENRQRGNTHQINLTNLYNYPNKVFCIKRTYFLKTKPRFRGLQMCFVGYRWSWGSSMDFVCWKATCLYLYSHTNNSYELGVLRDWPSTFSFLLGLLEDQFLCQSELLVFHPSFQKYLD